MDWIRVNTGLPTHPKALDLAELVQEPLAWAYVARLWMWAISNAQSGVVRGINPRRTIEAAAGWTGEPGALAAGLIRVGFVDELDDGACSLHDWDEHNGRAVERAKSEAERLREYRDRKREERVTQPRTDSDRGKHPKPEVADTRKAYDVRSAYGTHDVPGNGRTDGRTDEKKGGGGAGAASPAPAPTPRSSASVRPSAAGGSVPASKAPASKAPPPAPRRPGWEPLEQPVPVSQDPELTAEPLHGFEIPWSGGVASYDAAGAREMGASPPPEGVFWAWCAHRQGFTDHSPAEAPPSRKQLKRLHAALEHHGPERLRKAWLCWLADPWASTRSPPYALQAFLAEDQLAQMLDRAARAKWGPSELCAEDLEMLTDATEAA